MLGLTRQEKAVIIFLVAMALLGLGIKSVKSGKGRANLQVRTSELTQQEQDIDEILKQARIVNINRASLEEITSLPGIGLTLARRIVEYRQVHGRYEKPEQLLEVPGIGPKKFEKIKEFVVVE